MLIAGVDDLPSSMEISKLLFPVARAHITECSTYAVVCRLRSSPRYEITSKGGCFNHPDYPSVTVTFPKKAVEPKSKLSLTLKVGFRTLVINRAKRTTQVMNRKRFEIFNHNVLSEVTMYQHNYCKNCGQSKWEAVNIRALDYL